MGIRTGGRKVSRRRPRGIAAGGGSGFPEIQGQRQELTPPVPTTPFLTDKKGFRLGIYVIQEEKDDYLICKGFDPNAKFPFSEYSPPVPEKTILVAKPNMLQKTPWDGVTVELIVNGSPADVTFTYTDIGARTASSPGETDEVQRITMDYIVDDIIVAVEVRKNSGVDGLDAHTEDGVRLSWIDLNVSGRCWAVSDE